MNIPTFCIKRPVFTIVLSLFMISLGILSFKKLPVRELPKIDNPRITIRTSLNGASPALIEKEITTPIENSLSSLPGIAQMRSQSVFGESTIVLRYKLDKNIPEAMAELRDKMSSIIAQLPTDTLPPIIHKSDSNSMPTMIIGFIDNTRSLADTTDFLNRHVKPRLEELSGVGQVFFWGGRNYAIKIWLDPFKMAAHHITVSTIKNALKAQNLIIPSGQIESKNKNYIVITHSKLTTPKAFSKLIISDKHGTVTRLKDIAKISVESDNEDSYFRINGESAVGLGIITQTDANPLEVAKQVRPLLKKLKTQLPSSTKTTLIFDSAKSIEKSVKEVFITLCEATLLVTFIILCFLGNFKSSLIPIVTVPICLVSVFFPMQQLGFSINTITLLAIVLAIGLVVDDAIIILENNYRHMQNGLDKKASAIKGSSQMLFAVIAMTITLAAVYTPLVFIEGFSGKLFIQFGLTLSAAVIISGIVALTLSPMMCSKILTPHKGRYGQYTDRFFTRLQSTYQTYLSRFLKRSGLLFMLLGILSTAGVMLFTHLPKELASSEDKGYIFGMVTPPTGSSLKYTNRYTKNLESIYQTIPEKENYLAYASADSAFTVLTLKPWQERHRSQKQITQALNEQTKNLIGVDVFAVTPQPLGRTHAFNNGFSIRISTNQSYVKLNQITNDLIKRLTPYKGLTHLQNDLKLNREQFEIKINKPLAFDKHVKINDIADTIATMLGGQNPINFNYQDQSYPVKLQLAKNFRQDLDILDNIYVESDSGKNIVLKSLVSVKNTTGPSHLSHVNRQRTTSITGEIAKGYKVADVIKHVDKTFRGKLPENTFYTFSGAAKDYLDSKSDAISAFVLSILFIYLVLAAQFESFISPLVILLTVPLTIVGALLTLWLSSQSLTIYTTIGMISLIGLISKHGILIVEFANELKSQTATLTEAILQAASLRLRPILMTTLAMILGALPLTLTTGPSATSHLQLGLTIIGGMSIGTLFSLFIVPAGYLFLNKIKSN